MPTFPALGEEVGGYRVEELIGRGGMSVVYLAEQLALGRKVALKLLSPELSEDEEFRQRFIRESRLAGGMEHPNIIPVHEAGDVEGLLFIAMRYVQGSDLKALLLREGPLSLDRTIEIISQAASALDAAHARGLVHRDVKPGNLLVASGEGPEASEHIYLSDFGLTKKSDSKSRMTSTGSFVGTLDYVAPEQIQGKDVSGRTDLYSLACVACECLTGKTPFERDSDVAVMYAHLQDPPPKPTETRPDLPAGIDDVVGRALAKNPEDRYESCRDFIRALKELTGAAAAGVPVQRPARGRRRKQAPVEAPTGPRPTPTPPPVPVTTPVDSAATTQPGVTPGPSTKETTRPPRSFNTKVVALLAVPVLAGAAFFMARAGTDPEDKGNNPIGIPDSSSDPSTEPSGSPGGQDTFPGQLAFLEETKAGSSEFLIAVAHPPDGRPSKFPETTGDDWRNRRPDWAADGTFFAFARPDASTGLNLVTFDPAAERDLDELDIEGDQGSVAVSPDGEDLAFSQTTGGNMDIYIWDLGTKGTDRLTTNEGDDDSPEWSSDGTRIVFEREATGGNDIYIMDADGTNLDRVTDTPGINEKLPEFHPLDDTLIVYHQQEAGGDFGIYIHDTDASPRKEGLKIIDTDAFEMRPTWSPDGKFIAFDSDANRNLDIFIIPFDGVHDLPDPDDATPITDGRNDEQSPAWGPAV